MASIEVQKILMSKILPYDIVEYCIPFELESKRWITFNNKKKIYCYYQLVKEEYGTRFVRIREINTYFPTNDNYKLLCDNINKIDIIIELDRVITNDCFPKIMRRFYFLNQYGGKAPMKIIKQINNELKMLIEINSTINCTKYPFFNERLEKYKKLYMSNFMEI